MRLTPTATIDPNRGLSSEEAQSRLQQGQGNTSPKPSGRSESQIILANCLTFFNLVFIVLAVLIALSGSSIKNMTFLVVMIINTVIGCFQEIRAKRAVDKLTLVAAQTLKTIRDGKAQAVRSDLLVLGDVVEFSAGDHICADGVMLTGNLQVNEALITGEADAITKNPGDSLLSGSFVVSGRGRCQLTAVGADSFASKLAIEAKADPKVAKSEMMRSLDRLIKVVGIALIPIGLVLFYQQFKVLQLSMRISMEATVAALVGMIPEGLYLLTSIAVAASSLKLSRQRVLVQDMNCIETLARVDVLCVDKTGTITEPVMEVENILPLSQDTHEYLEAVLTGMYSEPEPENDTAKALQEMFHGPSSWRCLRRISFTSETKWSAAVFEDHGTFLTGAPEFIMGSRYEIVATQVEHWSHLGYRVLLVARYASEEVPAQPEPEKLTPLALVLLTNRIRPEAPETFRYFAQQGVTIKVISGDNPATAADVSRRAGIAGAENYVDATTLETEADFLEAADTYTVFGRVTPDKKRELIRALKKKKHTVAMTGDGVNDVLAMKESDCGIAMASGAQAANQIARLVLLDSDFSAMPGIVGEGRRVINNIQRAATLFLVKNIFSLGLALLTLLTDLPYPMIPLHLSIISSLTIGVPSFFLAMEPNYERISGRFLPGVLRRAFPGGLTNVFVILMAQIFMAAFAIPMEQIRTVCTAILAVVGLLVLFQVCKPFDRFRKIVWALMALALLVCFTLLRGLLDLHTVSFSTGIVMAALLIMTPTVFYVVTRMFDWGDRLVAMVRTRQKK